MTRTESATVTVMRKQLAMLRRELERFSACCDAGAQCLSREVVNGECFRQSSESKLGRIAVLDAHAKWARDLLDKSNA
jgi:hypothetical protein